MAFDGGAGSDAVLGIAAMRKDPAQDALLAQQCLLDGGR